MPKYILHYREIIVTPIIVEANNLEEAINLLKDGEYEMPSDPKDFEPYASELQLDQMTTKMFEAGYIAAEYENGEVVVEQKELDWSELNSHWN